MSRIRPHPVRIEMPVARATRQDSPSAPSDVRGDENPGGAAPEPIHDGFAERASRLAGHVGAVLSKLPRVIAFVPQVLWFTLEEAAIPLVLGAAALGSAVAVAGLGVAGVMETVQGARKGDAAQVLTGAGEVARGVLVGAAAVQTTVATLGTAAAAATVGVGLVHGALGIGCGAVKLHRGFETGQSPEKIEGSLLLGMGVCSLVATAGALMGPAVGVVLRPAIAVQAVLGTARFCYLRRDQITAGASRVAAHTRVTWERFCDLFRPHPSPTDPNEPPPAPTP